jgi:hypothetical protein
MRAGLLLVVMASGALGNPAQAQSLKLLGTAGYLSEWEVSGAVSVAGNAFSGPLIWKHVGLCSLNGPEEKSGTIRFRLSKIRSAARIDATLSFGSAQCSFGGEFTGVSKGFMNCSDAGHIPISISISDP